jgi:hypothetical protein
MKFEHLIINEFTGQRLCTADKVNIPGQGTYEKLGYIYAKFAGVVKVLKHDNVRKQLYYLSIIIK